MKSGNPAEKPTAGLWLVATPIGNLEDVSRRALSVLQGVDVIACEDTRHTARLLSRHSITRQLSSYHEHNAAQVRPKLIKSLKGGQSVALVSDAGTPLISDPGYKLVRAALDEDIAVTGCPGPSSPLLALIVSGLPTDKFYFAGFLPTRAHARREALKTIANLNATLMFLEPPRRLIASLRAMLDAFGPRPAAIAREMTKLHEEVRRGTLEDLASYYDVTGPPKGEIVIVVGGASRHTLRETYSIEKLDQRIETLLVQTSLRDTVTILSNETGLSRSKIYARAVAHIESQKQDPRKE